MITICYLLQELENYNITTIIQYHNFKTPSDQQKSFGVRWRMFSINVFCCLLEIQPQIKSKHIGESFYCRKIVTWSFLHPLSIKRCTYICCRYPWVVCGAWSGAAFFAAFCFLGHLPEKYTTKILAILQLYYTHAG